jgi:hypothetical protein
MTEEEFLKKCIKIIKSSPSDDAKKEIAKMKHPIKNEKVGLEGAEKVYKYYTQTHIVKYDINKYCNNEKEYVDKIKKIG